MPAAHDGAKAPGAAAAAAAASPLIRSSMVDARTGAKYSGELLPNGTYHSQGTLVLPSGGGMYEGEFVDGKMEGRGALWVPACSGGAAGGESGGSCAAAAAATRQRPKRGQSGGGSSGNGANRELRLQYTGDWRAGAPHGGGSWHGADGSSYDGEFNAGRREGRGVSREPSGAVAGAFDEYEGDWLDGLRHGRGTMAYASGDVYTGEWRRGLRHGRGSHTFAARAKRYDGVWADDAPACGAYCETAPVAPGGGGAGSGGALPSVQLVEPEKVLGAAVASAVAAAAAGGE